MKRTIITIVLFAATLVLHADIYDANIARGFSGKLYQFGDLDSVNRFNNNLITTIPIAGLSAGTLSLPLTLVYNSRVWEYEPTYLCWIDWQGFSHCDEQFTVVVPSYNANAGMGWEVSLGSLAGIGFDSASYEYNSPDGGKHEFGHTLHGETDWSPEYGYTTDESYLRIITNLGQDPVVEFPNGEQRTFSTSLRNDLGILPLTDVVDRLGNRIHVDYATGGSCATCPAWVLTATPVVGEQRRAYIFFEQTNNTSTPNATAFYPYVIKKIVLPTVGHPLPTWDPANPQGALATAFADTSAAAYTFNYEHGATVSKEYTDISSSRTDFQIPNQTAITTSLLQTLQLPTGESYQMEYSRGPAANYTGQQRPPFSGETGDTIRDFSCRLTKLTLPTGGVHTYEYREFTVIQQDVPGASYISSIVGVAKRTITADPNAAQPHHEIYEYLQDTGMPTGGNMKLVQIVSIIKPPKPQSDAPQEFDVAHFTTCDYNYSPCVPAEYGLPLTRYPTYSGETVADGDLSLSTQNFTGPNDAHCGWENNTNCTLLRSTWVKYDTESNKKQRLVATKTKYEATGNGGTSITTRYSGFDGLGHYRTTTTAGSFTPIVRTTTINYNRRDARTSSTTYDSGEYPCTGSCTTPFVMPARTAPWLLNTATSTLTWQDFTDGLAHNAAPNLHRELTLFDQSTGQLRAQRTLRHPVSTDNNVTSDLAGDDILTTYEYNDNGELTTERSYGGDRGGPYSVATAPLASVIGTGTPEFTTTHLYNCGTLTRSEQGGVLSTDRTVDCGSGTGSTGAVITERDSGGATTTYEYYNDGRVKSVTLPAGAKNTFLYNKATTSTNASVDVTSMTASVTLGAMHFAYDGLGRIIEEGELLPNDGAQHDAWKTTLTEYNPRGWVWRTQTPGPTYPRTSVTYDPLGRVASVSGPDGSTVTTTYDTNQSKTTTTSYNQPPAVQPPTLSTRTEEFDIFGRLTKVTENSESTIAARLTGTPVTTSYEYDVVDHLVSVTMLEQTRHFGYDGAGRLTSETHPELPAGSTTYAYNARGQVLRKTYAQGPTLYNEYDDAGRLLRVRTTDSTTPCTPGTCLKEFSYATANEAGAFGRGKLKSATRFNPENYLVTETYDYETGAGPNQRTTTITQNGTTKQTFAQLFTYDPLGQLREHTYPTCAAPCSADATTVTNTYSNTYLTGVSTQSAAGNVAVSIGYSTAGIPQTVTHGATNANTDRYAPDPTGMPRPSSITFESLYDGAPACTAPSITGQPLGSSVAIGATATLSVTATGTQPLSYVWYRKRGTETDFTPMPGATGPSLQDTVTGPASYYVTVSNACGQVQSQTASVTIPCTPVGNVSQPIASDPKIVLRTPVTLSVYATGTALHYTWYRLYWNEDTTPAHIDHAQLSGDSPTITDTPPRTGQYQYYVEVSNACTASPVTSQQTLVEVELNDCHVKILGANTCLRVAADETPQLEVRNEDGSAPPASYTYQWSVCYNAPSHDPCPTENFQPLAGATTPTLRPAGPAILPQLLGERDDYRVHVTCGGPASDPTVRVRWDDLWITDHPVMTTGATIEANYGEPVSMMVNGYGETKPVWDWYKGETGTKLPHGGTVTVDGSASTIHLPGTLSSPYWAQAFNSASTWGCNLPEDSRTGWVVIHPLLKTLSLQDTHVLVGTSLQSNSIALDRGADFTDPVTVQFSATPNSVTITPATITLSGTGPAAFTITPSAVTQATTVTISASVQGFDASTKAASLLVHPPGVQSITITPSTLSPAPGTQATATGTITLEASPTAVTNVTLTPLAGGAPFSIPSPVVFTPGSIQAGQTTDRVRTFAITANAVSAPVTLTLKASANGREAQATLTANPQVQVQVSPTTMLVASRATGTVTLGAPVTGSPARVELSSSTTLLKVPAFIDINVGQTSTTFFVDADFSATPYSGVVTATYAGASSSVTISVSGGRMAAIDLGTDTAIGGEILHGFLRTTAPVLYPYQALMATRDLTGLSQAVSCQTQIQFGNGASEKPFDLETFAVTEQHLAYLSAQSRQDNSVASTTIQILPRATYPVTDLAATATATTNKISWTNPGMGNGWQSAIFYAPGACPASVPEVGTYGSRIATTYNPVGTLRDSYTHTGRTAGTTSCYVVYAYDGGSEYSTGRMITTKNPSTAAIKWQFASGVTAMTPVSSNAGQLFLTTSRRTMFALTAGAAGGSPVTTWTPDRNAAGASLPVTYPVGGSANVVMYALSSGAGVVCGNASTGARIWGTAMSPEKITADIVGVFVARGAPYDLVVAASNNITKENLVYGINPANGYVVWTFGTGLNLGPITNSPIIDTTTNRVYFTARKRAGTSANTLWGIQLSLSGSTWTATSLGSFDIGDADASPALWNGRLYAANNTGTIYCFDIATGALKWTFATGNGMVKGALVTNPLSSLNLLFSTTNYVWRIADMGTGAQLNMKISAIPNPSRPVLGGNDNAYIGGGDGKLYQLSGLSTTQTLQNLALTSGAIGTPRYDTGMVYVGSESGVISAVTSPF